MKNNIALTTAVLTTVSILGVSCAKQDSAERNLGDSQAPAPAASQRPAPVYNWHQLHEEFNPALLSVGDCDKPYKFTVGRDGSFIAGPCKPNGSTDTGRLTDEEMAELNRRADVFATADLGIQPDCEFDIHLGSDAVFITLPPNSHLRVKSYKGFSFETCYHGGRAKAKPLASYLRALLKKYYPRN